MATIPIADINVDDVELLVRNYSTRQAIQFLADVERQRIEGTVPTVSSTYRVRTLNNQPASATASGTAGTVLFTSDFIYVCVATNSWKRVAIATW
jgi:hypothetical protein